MNMETKNILIDIENLSTKHETDKVNDNKVHTQRMWVFIFVYLFFMFLQNVFPYKDMSREIHQITHDSNFNDKTKTKIKM